MESDDQFVIEIPVEAFTIFADKFTVAKLYITGIEIQILERIIEATI